MKIIIYEKGMNLVRRPETVFSSKVEEAVGRIVSTVIKKGDVAAVAATKKIDGIVLTQADLKVAPETIAAAADLASAPLVRALKKAISNIRKFHVKQKPKSWQFSPETGIKLGQIVTPLDAVGVWIPGGEAPLVSTVLMCVIPAQVAGVPRIVAAIPALQGALNPGIAMALKLLNITELYQMNGPAAIAALAYGTQSIAPVDSIVGPGNAYVQCAKRMVFGRVNIDMIAGTSEVAIIVDASVNAHFVAADMIAQGEHSGDNPVDCIVTSKKVALAITDALKIELAKAPRGKIARKSLDTLGRIIVVKNVLEAAELSNQLAPEHLQLLVQKPRELLKHIRHAGSIFLGAYTPVSLGDFYAGTNHVLPTGTTARFSSPLGVYDFVKMSGVTEYSEKALIKHGRNVDAIALAEGLPGHGRAVTIRTGKKV